MEEKEFNGKIYRLVTLRNRTKWVAKDGSAINPFKTKQKATVHINPDGYPCFGGGVPVHLYVATAWVDGWFEGAEVNHKDFNRMNYSSENLEWISHKENISYSALNSNHYKEGNRGTNNGRAVLTLQQVEEIRLLFAKGLSTMEVVKLYHPTANAKERKNLWGRYNDIKLNKTWKE